MHSRLEYLLQGLSDQFVKIQVLLAVAQPELQDLCHRVFGCPFTHDTFISCSYLVRSLVSAAVCEWVFERELRETCIASSLLMETVLSQVALLGESSVANNCVEKARQPWCRRRRCGKGTPFLRK